LKSSLLSSEKQKLLELRRFCKSNFDAKYGEWLGCHMIGAGVTDMIAEAVVARKLETTGHEILKSIHPHPTMSEAVMGCS
jgi:dihydrolipoamide dehydrogenase